MATIKTGPDSIRVFLTGDPAGTSWTHDGSLGGSRLPVEVGQGFLVADALPGILIDLVALTVEGTGYLRATAGLLEFKAPTDTAYGTGVTVAAGASALLYSATASLGYIRVTNVYAAASFGGLATITVLSETNNAVGASSGTVAGETAYRGLMVQNVSDAAITVSAMTAAFSPHPFYCGFEAVDANGKIQRIADEHTEPAGITWRTVSPVASSGVLQPGACAGLWLKRVFEACAAPVPTLLRYCALSWTYSGTQWRRLSGRTRILNAAASYQLFKGEDALPDFSAPPADTDASLPLTVVVAPPGAGLLKTVYLTTRKTNTGGLQSRNQYGHQFLIDDAGALIVEPLHAPSNITLTAVENCGMRLTATYQGGYDDDPATHFYIWLTTDGSAPNPAGAVTYTADMIPDGTSDGAYLSMLLGPYAHAQVIKVLVRSYRAGDAVYSNNTTVMTVNVSTSALRGPDQPQTWDDDLLAEVRSVLGMPYFTLVESATGNIHWHVERGQVRFYFDTVCAFVITDTEFRTMWMLSSGATFGAATKNGVDVADANTAYLSVNDVRVAKLDLAALEITMVAETSGTPANSFESGPIYVTATAIYFQNWIGGIWRTVATLAADGTFTTDLIMRGCSTTDELFG